MKRILLWISLLAILATGLYLLLRWLPYYYYQNFLWGRSSHEFFRLPRWQKAYLVPGERRGSGESVAAMSALWREFHLGDVVVPLPAGHPLYHSIPILHYQPSRPDPQVGMQLVSPSGREIARLYLLKSSVWVDQLDAQKLFQLPMVRREIKRKAPEQVWQDLFKLKIDAERPSWSEMCYHLYLLYLRARMLPENFVNYGQLDADSMAYIEIPSKNKDYRTEIVFSYDRGLLLSYVLLTDRTNSESEEVRARFLKGIKFRASDKGLTPILYREFKQLNFSRQTDQEGMLYLFSAWSHDLNNQEMLKELIYYLERGEKNAAQLKPIYRYVFDRYKKTFTTRAVGLEFDDSDIRLQREIELEGLAKQQQEQKKVIQPQAVSEPTAKEKMEEYLRRTKAEKGKKSSKPKDKLIIH